MGNTATTSHTSKGTAKAQPWEAAGSATLTPGHRTASGTDQRPIERRLAQCPGHSMGTAVSTMVGSLTTTATPPLAQAQASGWGPTKAGPTEPTEEAPPALGPAGDLLPPAIQARPAKEGRCPGAVGITTTHHTSVAEGHSGP